MTKATKELIAMLIRLAKGMLTALEKWLEQQ
jgi:hypothetical protein